MARFQTTHGLPATGTAAPLTTAALHAPHHALAPGAGYRSPSGSAAVRVLQRRLAHQGYNPGPIDGRYGPHTMRAVARFQHTHHLTSTGIAETHTATILTALTHHHHPTRSAVSAPIISHPPPEHQPQLPAPTPTAGPAADSAVHIPALPVTPVLLGLAALGLITATASYTRTRARTRPATHRHTPSHQPGVRVINNNPPDHDREPPPLPLTTRAHTPSANPPTRRPRDRPPHTTNTNPHTRAQINPGGRW